MFVGEESPTRGSVRYNPLWAAYEQMGDVYFASAADFNDLTVPSSNILGNDFILDFLTSLE